jgi:polysaccharide deacetylase family protein (PEP-CTERM system associated)
MSVVKNQLKGRLTSCLTIDVEDWFHILDDSAVPSIEHWSSLETRIERNLETMLALLDAFSVKATFFWLGWIAKRHKGLVRKCQNAGHEVASHGYAHVLAYEVGRKAFRRDITRAKAILEDVTGGPIRGFRAPGFSITHKAPWAFEITKEIGYEYDSSIFPAIRGHGGIANTILGPHLIETAAGNLIEMPLSVIEVFGRRASLFGGGYLRLAPVSLIKWGIQKLEQAQRPLILYVHPREIDPDHPRLPLPLFRRFKCYVNLKSTLPKLEWLCQNYSFCTMHEMANFLK